MTPLIRIGAERNLFPNPYLSRLDERTGMAGTWDRHFDDAFRYSFVSVGDSELNSVLALSAGIANIEDLNPAVVVGWVYHEAGSYRIRSKFLESSLRRNGWDVVISEGIALACRPMQEGVNSVLVPDSCERTLQGYFVLAGGEWSLVDLCKPPLLASIRHFCLMQRMQPSYELVQGICASGVSMMYASLASDVRRGIVLVGPKSRAPNLERSCRDARISEVLWDVEAPQAWVGNG